MKIREIVKALEAIAPPQLAAEWDNVGLLVGDERAETNKLMLCIDLTERVLTEAKRTRAGMVMAYHPVIYKSISRVTAGDAPVVYAAAAGGLAVYSMHTALDAAPGGTNDSLADVMGLTNTRPLEPIVRGGAYKVVAFVPPADLHSVADAAFAAGAGLIGNYERCGFFTHGIGTFLGGSGTHPTIGTAGNQEAAEELRLEVIATKSKIADVCSAIRAAHSYETPAVDVYPIDEVPEGCGLGRIGTLPRGVTVNTLIRRIKKATGLKKVLLAASNQAGRSGKGKLVSTAACCAGSCGSLYRAAAAAGATFYLTGEMRHHEALAAAAMGMTVVCLGHSNSERIALKRLAEQLAVISPKLKVVISASDADPFEIV